MSDNFTESEQIGRKLFKSFLDLVLATDLQPTEDLYNPVDYYFTLKDKKILAGVKVVAEIKVRDFKYESYYTHLMEVSKYEALILEKKDKNLNSAWYVNFFLNGLTGEVTAYIYTTEKIALYGYKMYQNCPKTTAVYSRNIDKYVYMIPTRVAFKMEFVNGKWLKL